MGNRARAGALVLPHTIGVVERAADTSAANWADVAGDAKCHEPSPREIKAGWDCGEAKGAAASAELDGVGRSLTPTPKDTGNDARTERGSSGSVASRTSACCCACAVDEGKGQVDCGWFATG